MPVKLIDNNIKLLGNVANYQVDRHSLLTSNLANVETPNYKQKDVKFEELLQANLPEPNALRMARTDSRHMPTYDFTGKVQPQVQVEGDVNIDRQMARLAENNLKYNAIVQLLGRRYREIRETIDQGGR